LAVRVRLQNLNAPKPLRLPEELGVGARCAAKATNMDGPFRTEGIPVIVRVASRPKDAFAPDA
jgi:hypothetical protein